MKIHKVYDEELSDEKEHEITLTNVPYNMRFYYGDVLIIKKSTDKHDWFLHFMCTTKNTYYLDFFETRVSTCLQLTAFTSIESKYLIGEEIHKLVNHGSPENIHQ